MTKDEMIELLKKLDLELAEGEQDDINKSNIFPRILFFEYIWDFSNASSKVYNSLVTYQISFFSRIPRDPKLIQLINSFLNSGVPLSRVQIEYVSDGFWHSYFSVEVKDDVLCLVN